MFCVVMGGSGTSILTASGLLILLGWRRILGVSCNGTDRAGRQSWGSLHQK